MRNLSKIISTIAGCFVVDVDKVIDKVMFNDLKEYENKENIEKELMQKHSGAEIAAVFPRLKEYIPIFFEKNIALTKKRIKESVKKDEFVILAVKNIEDIEKVANGFSKRLRDWVSLYLPELDRKVTRNEKIVELVLEKNKNELMKEIGIEDSMGSNIAEKDLVPMKNLAKEIKKLFELKEAQESYIEEVMQDLCPNLLCVAGPLVGAKLLVHTGTLEKLATMPSSTIQLLGAEKALFRHMKNKKAKCPRHGVIINHPLIANAKQKDHGKVARHLAAAITIAARVDYFGGESTKGYELRQELDEKFGKKNDN